jgi:hypothetical protein
MPRRNEVEDDADVEKQFDKSTGKKRNYTGYQKYTLVKEWATGEDAVLEDAEIEHEIYSEDKKIKHASGLKKTPCHKPSRRIFISGSSIQKNITPAGPTMDTTFSMSAPQSMRMSSAGETTFTNYQTELQASRILRITKQSNSPGSRSERSSTGNGD